MNYLVISKCNQLYLAAMSDRVVHMRDGLVSQEHSTGNNPALHC